MKKKIGKNAMERYKKKMGYVRPWMETLAKYDPEYLNLVINTLLHVYEGGPLPTKVVEFILIALDAATSYERGLRRHMRNALTHGATKEEILQVLEVSTICAGERGTVTRGIEILDDIVKELEQ